MSKIDAGQAQNVSPEPVWKSLVGPLLIVLLAVYFYFLAGAVGRSLLAQDDSHLPDGQLRDQSR
jgi:hypothetical protein